MDKKRIFAIIGFVAVTILLGFALYWVFFRAEPVPTTPTGPTTPTTGQQPTTGLPQAGQGQTPGTGVTEPGTPITGDRPVSSISDNQTQESIVQVSTETILSAAADGSGAKFYNDQDGKFYRIDTAGTVRELSDQVFFNVDSVTWSPTKNESIIEYPDGSNIYYNFDTKEQVSLPRHWEEFSFSNQGDRIAAKSLGLSAENRWLIVSSPDGNNVELIEPMGDNADRVTVDWSPNNQIVALSRTGEALGIDRQEVLFVGLNGENFKSTVIEGRGLRSQWSPEGNRLLYSVHSSRSDFKPELWIVNASGDSIGSGRTALNINTWADKCTFGDERFVYCGVPTTLQTGAGYAPEIADGTPDQIIRIDTTSGARTIFPTNEAHTVQDIFISEDGNTLYFTDKNTPGLFQIDV